jgi:hypothetical protein
MAMDLFLGRTGWNWSRGVKASSVCGAGTELFTVLEDMPPALAERIRGEIDATSRETIRLINLKRLPEADRNTWKRFFKKWLVYWDGKKGDFSSQDRVTLINFQKANKLFSDRIAIFSQVAKTPLVPRKKEEKIEKPFRPEGSTPPSGGSSWKWLVGVGLGMIGLGFLSGRK